VKPKPTVTASDFESQIQTDASPRCNSLVLNEIACEEICDRAVSNQTDQYYIDSQRKIPNNYNLKLYLSALDNFGLGVIQCEFSPWSATPRGQIPEIQYGK
jgi:hypothetical protein